MIGIPEAFAASTVAREGDAGRAWIARLPGVVRELCDDWRLTPDGAPLHGYVALVVPVRRGDVPLMLKVSWIDQWSAQEALALRCWQGEGAVTLLEAREEHGAMLLERLDPERTLEDAPADEAIEVAARLLRRLSVPAPAELRTMGEELQHLQATLRSAWERAGRPFSELLLDRALELARMPTSAVAPTIVNQDLHYGNVLRGVREPWLVIDPKPLAAELAFGTAQLLWSRFDDLSGRAALERRVAILSDVAGLDRVAVRQWSLLRIVDYWLWAVGVGLRNDPMKCRTLVSWLEPALVR